MLILIVPITKRIKTLKPEPNGRHIAGFIFNISKIYFCILTKILLKFLLRGLNGQQISTCFGTSLSPNSDKPQSEPTITQFIDATMSNQTSNRSYWDPGILLDTVRVVIPRITKDAENKHGILEFFYRSYNLSFNFILWQSRFMSIKYIFRIWKQRIIS